MTESEFLALQRENKEQHAGEDEAGRLLARELERIKTEG